MKIGTTYPSFNWDIRNSFRDALGSSVEVKLITSYEELEECKLLCFPGGEDVNPELYHQGNTHSHGVNKNRDERERFFFKHAQQKKIPMFGMCRGLQFLAVMMGFELVQDIYTDLEKKHGGGHTIEKIVDSIVSNNFSSVNSLHHQGVFGDTDINLLRKYRDRGMYVTSIYNSIVESFESDGVIATQFHPEFMHSKDSNSFFTDLGVWIEKPELTFNLDEYINLLRFAPRPEVKKASLTDLQRETATIVSSFGPSEWPDRWTSSSLSSTYIPGGASTGRVEVVMETVEPEEEEEEEEVEYEDLFNEEEEDYEDPA